MGAREFFAKRLRQAADSLSTETWEQQKSREAAEFLAQAREREPGLVNAGNEPFGYMPRVMGDVMGGRLSVSVLRVDELRWWADECVRSLRVNQGMNAAEGIAKDEAYLAVAVAAFKDRGITYVPPAAVPPFVPPPPPFDPSRGR